MSVILISGDPDDSRRAVAVTLPRAAWEFLEAEADFRRANLSAHVSDMLLCALQVRGYVPARERLTKNTKVEAIAQ